MTTGRKKIHVSKPNQTDWHQKILLRLKSKRSFVWIFLIFVAISSIIVLVQNAVSIKNQIADPAKIDESITEINEDSSWAIQADDTRMTTITELYSLPYTFFSEASENRVLPNQVFSQSSFASDNLNITVTTVDPQCQGYKFVMAKKVFGGTNVHQILPLDNLMASNYEVKGSYYDVMANERDDDGDSAIRKWNSCVYENTENEDLGEFEELVKFDNPGVIIKINNNSGENVQINAIEARVRTSSKNPFPLLHFENGVGGELGIFNYGSGTIENVKLQFKLQPVNASVQYNQPYKYEMTIPAVNERSPLEFDFGNNEYLKTFLVQEGVSEEALDYSAKRELPRNFLDENERWKPKYCGNFPDAQVRVVGKAIYSGATASGAIFTDTLNFNCIQYFSEFSIGGGTTGINRGRYHILLDSSRKNYGRSISIEKNIAPKSGGSLELILFSGFYSYHYFDLVIHYNGGKEIVLPDFFLNEFLTVQDMFKLKAKRRKN